MDLITVLAWVLLACFVWSIVLFLRALVRGRDQEVGFVYSLVGAGVFLLTYADLLGVSSLRTAVFNFLGNAAPGQSTHWLLWVVLVIYALRSAVFLRVFERFERLNDRLAPLLAFSLMALLLTEFLTEVIGWGAIGWAVTTIALWLGYFGNFVGLVAKAAVIGLQLARRAARTVRHVSKRLLTWTIWALGRLELLRKNFVTVLDRFSDRLRAAEVAQIDRHRDRIESDEAMLHRLEDELEDTQDLSSSRPR